MNLIFDTNIILGIVRSKRTSELIDFLNPSKETVHIPVVVEAELKSIAIQNKWGSEKINKLDYFLDLFTFTEVTKSTINTYVQIDSFLNEKTLSFQIMISIRPKTWAKTIFGLRQPPLYWA